MKTKYLSVGIKGMKSFISGSLSYSIDESSSIWFIDDYGICISLTKQTYGELWLRVLARQESMNESEAHTMKRLIKEQSKADTGDLLNTEINRNPHPQPHIKCQLNKCLSFKNVLQLMTGYKSYIDNQIFIKQLCIANIYQKIANKYSVTDALDDFNHLVHSHVHEFEEIYNILNDAIYNNNGCELCNCLLMRRHHRNRSVVTKNEYILDELFCSSNGIVELQILDRVHCHYFHSFDIGFKLTQTEKRDIMNQEKKTSDEFHHIICSKILSKHNRLDRLNSSENKFKKIKPYSFGNRFYYWRYYKYYWGVNDPVHTFTPDWPPHQINQLVFNHSNSSTCIAFWYIEPKHKDIKTELLCNDICCIGRKQWENVVHKASIFYETEKAKCTFCSRQKSAVWYEMKFGDFMSVNHLIAMLMYCNYDLLSRKYSETYRRCDENEIAQDVVERHRNYYWLGRYLRECVECFGMTTNSNTYLHSITVYHGVNDKFTFSSMHAYIKVPFSVTTSYPVAVNFCNNTGMILELSMNVTTWSQHLKEGIESLFRMDCCDMSWISDYTQENEIFCIGGLHPFRFEAIIEPTGINYVTYMTALKQITYDMHLEANMMYGAMKFLDPLLQSDINILCPSTIQEKKLYFQLLSHQIWKSYPQHPSAHEFKDCSDYFKTILDLHFQNIKMIRFVEGD
eukprot:155086_1